MGDDPDHERRLAREGGTIEEIDVPFLTLDEIVGERKGKIDFLSIDVEGAEFEVLQSGDSALAGPDRDGGDNTLGANRQVEDLLVAAGYERTLPGPTTSSRSGIRSSTHCWLVSYRARG